MASVLPRRTQFVLDESRIPRAWYNIAADLPAPHEPAAPPGDRTSRSAPATSRPLFPMALILQEVSGEREIEIPDPVREAYALYRPSPLHRAHRLEKALDTPAHIYYKYEGVSPAGSHKPNTAIPQAFYNKQEGVKRLATETGAGQWGSALSFAGAMFGLEVKVYMVRASYDQKPYRRILMETYGAQVVASPSPETNYGRAVLAATPDSPGSLGMAISEAVEDAATRDDTKYSLGSVLNHVLLHQTVVGLEALEQMEMAGEEPDVIIACAGGGSNFAGLTFPFVGPQAPGRGRLPGHRRRARGRAVADPRRLRLRLRRHRAHGPDREDAHAGQRVHARADPRRWPPLPRHGAARVAAQGAGRDRGAERPPAGRVRGRRPVRPGRGHPAGAREHARDQGRGRRGARGQGGRRVAGDPVQPLGPRALRPRGLRELPAGHASRTTSTRPRRSRPRSPTCPRSADDRRRDPAAARRAACPRIDHVPKLACRACGRQIYTVVAPRVAVRRGAALSALRRVPGRGAPRRRAAHARPPPEPARRSRPAGRHGRAARRRAAQRPATPGRPADAGGDRPDARRTPRPRPDRRFDRARPPRATAGRWSRGAWTPDGIGAASRRRRRDHRSGRDRPRRMPSRAPTWSCSPRRRSACLELLRDLGGPLRGRRCAPDAVVTDVASTKARSSPWLATSACGSSAATRWPGREASGFAASDARLFDGRPWVVVPPAVDDDAAIARVEALARRVRRATVRMSAADHDRAVAAISHLPLVLSAALVEAVAGAHGRAASGLGGSPRASRPAAGRA